MKKKVVLITGASSGIGQAIALHLVSGGYVVYGTSRNSTLLEGVTMIQMDVNKPFIIQKAIDCILENEGKIDVLINNAGMGISGAIELATEEEISLQMNTNFLGAVRVVQSVLPVMREQKRGLIITISSIGGIMGLPFQGFYSASKFAIEGFCEALSMEVLRQGIQVVVVEPGDFATGFTANRQLSSATSHHVAYQQAYQKTMNKIVKDETGGLNPIVIARKIEQIIESKHPAFRYVIANTEQRFSVWLKRLLPYSIFRKMLSNYYES